MHDKINIVDVRYDDYSKTYMTYDNFYIIIDVPEKFQITDMKLIMGIPEEFSHTIRKHGGEEMFDSMKIISFNHCIIMSSKYIDNPFNISLVIEYINNYGLKYIPESYIVDDCTNIALDTVSNDSDYYIPIVYVPNSMATFMEDISFYYNMYSYRYNHKPFDNDERIELAKYVYKNKNILFYDISNYNLTNYYESLEICFSDNLFVVGKANDAYVLLCKTSNAGNIIVLTTDEDGEQISWIEDLIHLILG